MTTATTNPAADPEVRRTGIGSSDAGVIAGLSRFKTPLDVYMEKRGLVGSEPAGEAAEWGQILEPVILREYAVRSDVDVLGRWPNGELVLFEADGTESVATEGPVALLDTLRHSTHECMMCHVDGIAIVGGEPVAIVEAKTAGAWMEKEWGEAGTDEIPASYMAQVQHQMDILQSLGHDLPVHVPALIAGQQWRQYYVERDREFCEKLREIESAFWVRVQDGMPPDPEPDERGKKSLARLYPEDTGEERIVSPADLLHRLAVDLCSARRAVNVAQGFKAECENRIKVEMEDAAKLVGEGFTISWKKSKDRVRVDYEAAFEELAERYTVPEPEARGIVEANTTTKPGPRIFRPSFKGLEG